MKKILSLCCAVILSAPLLVSAADVKTATGKNLCALNSEYCAGQSFTLQEEIAQLQNELQKGTSVYSADELKLLVAKLDEYQGFMTVMNSNP
jgi:Skp family chaperone for outer membrane proteins